MHRARQAEIPLRIGQAVLSWHDITPMMAAPMISAIRAKTGWSQARLADELEVQQSQISRAAAGGNIHWDFGIKLRDLARELGVLTGETVSPTMTFIVRVRGVAHVADELGWFGDDAKRVATLPIPIPTDCFGLEITSNGVLIRARKGDLVVVGPLTENIDELCGLESFVNLLDGRRMIGTIISGGASETYTIIGPHGPLAESVRVLKGAAYFATIGAGRWESAAAE